MLTYVMQVGLDRELPKKRRRTEVAVAEDGSLMPSAGTIFKLQIVTAQVDRIGHVGD